MSDNPFDEMAKVSAADTRPMEHRVDNERRFQERTRAIRWTCRIAIAIFFAAAITANVLGNTFGHSWLTTTSYVLAIPAGICLVVLVFMGGYVGGKGRALLSQRMRDLADD